MTTATATAVATVLAALIAAIVGYATQRSAARAQVATTNTTTRAEVERDAFDRAQRYYTDTIDRQEREIRELEAEVVVLKDRVKRLEADATKDHRAIRQLRQEIEDREEKIRVLQRRLDIVGG